MTANPPTAERYGPAGFVATLANVLVLGLIASIFVGVYIVLVGLPALLIDAGVAFALSRARGTAGQIGWGMLIGCLTVSLTVVGGIAVFAVGKAIGL